jgi:hypothetical protein
MAAKMLDIVAANLQMPAHKTLPDSTIASVAKVIHEANKAFCETEGDFSQKSWDDAPAHNHSSAIAGVKALILDPEMSPEDTHDAWVKQKQADGWTYGNTKDADQKTHPSLVPYDKLSLTEKYKDHLFRDITLGYLSFLRTENLV